MTQYMDPYDIVDHEPHHDLVTDLNTNVVMDWPLGQACSLEDQDECESCT